MLRDGWPVCRQAGATSLSALTLLPNAAAAGMETPTPWETSTVPESGAPGATLRKEATLSHLFSQHHPSQPCVSGKGAWPSSHTSQAKSASLGSHNAGVATGCWCGCLGAATSTRVPCVLPALRRYFSFPGVKQPRNAALASHQPPALQRAAGAREQHPESRESPNPLAARPSLGLTSSSCCFSHLFLPTVSWSFTTTVSSAPGSRGAPFRSHSKPWRSGERSQHQRPARL